MKKLSNSKTFILSQQHLDSRLHHTSLHILSFQFLRFPNIINSSLNFLINQNWFSTESTFSLSCSLMLWCQPAVREYHWWRATWFWLDFWIEVSLIATFLIWPSTCLLTTDQPSHFWWQSFVTFQPRGLPWTFNYLKTKLHFELCLHLSFL